MSWSFAAGLPTILLALAVLCGAAWLGYTNWNRNDRRKSVALLESLRFALVFCLTITLLRPELVRKQQRTEKPEVAVLFDASQSMQTRDLLDSTNKVMTRAAWIERIRSQKFLEQLGRNAKVTEEMFGKPEQSKTNLNSGPQTAQSGTDLNQELEKVLQRESNLKAVLMFTDGDWNSGKSPVVAATRYRDRGVPIFSIPVGRETALPDVSLDSVAPPAYGIFGEQIAVPVKITSHLPRAVKTTITLNDGSREETRKEIVIPAEGELKDAILWSPHAVGDKVLRISIPVEQEESLVENNQQTGRTTIRVETLKVLVVDSLPRWEYRYLRNALARDPGVEVHSILFHPEIGPGGGRNYLPTFPGSRELISHYDVIFLGDVGIGQNELKPEDAELIKGVVEQQGTGLVFLPGRRGRELTFLDSALKDLMPVVLDEKRKEGIGLQNESTLMLSTVGKRHLLTRFDSDETRNDELWKQLPGYFWSAAVEKSRPGSEVLAVHSAMRNASGRMPLLVTRPAGNGKVLFMGSDSAWRWRRGVEDKFHYRFWSQVVRWMAHQRHLSEKQGIRLTYSPETPQVGETVFLQSIVLNNAGFPIEEGPVFGRITSPSGKSERLEFNLTEGGWGVFTSTFSPQEPGLFKITVQSEKYSRTLDTQIEVASAVREKLGQPINKDILSEIATITGGQIGGMDDLNDLIQKISILPEPRPLEKRFRLWNSPFWGGTILFLLAAYWVGRKISGLI